MRILHISDCHIDTRNRFDQELMIKKMIDRTKTCVAENQFDLVVFAGDLVYSGQLEEFDRARTLLLDPLQEVLDLPRDRIVLVPGNHDVDRSRISELLEPGLRTLSSTEEIDSLLAASHNFQDASNRLENWTIFHSDFYNGCDSVEIVNPLSVVHTLEIDHTSVGVAALNSAWRAGSADDRSNLLIGESQACEALDQIDNRDVRIACFHHPLNWLAKWNYELIRPELESRSLVVLTGHEHEADLIHVDSVRGSAIYLPAGSLYQGRNLPNYFSVIDVDTRDRTFRAQLFSWKSPRKEFDRAVELVENGSLNVDLPTRRDTSGIPLPKYSQVNSTLISVTLNKALLENVDVSNFPRSIEEVLVEPPFYRAPYGEVAAAKMLTRQTSKNSTKLENFDIRSELKQHQVILINGEHLSGVTNAILWILFESYQADVTRIPVFTDFRPLTGSDPVEKLIRDELISRGLFTGVKANLPSLIVGIDDVKADNPVLLERVIRHISNHSERIFVFGTHGKDGDLLGEAFKSAELDFVATYLGPFGRPHLRKMISTFPDPGAALHVDNILDLVFGHGLPRNPFVLAALITVMCRQQYSGPINQSAVIDALVDLLLGKLNPLETELGLDFRRRERLLQELARQFEISEEPSMPRLVAENFIAEYFRSRGIESANSPGKLLEALVKRRILKDEDGIIRFTHAPYQHIMAARLMREDSEFASEILDDQLAHTSVVKHAVALSRDKVDWLRAVNDATRSTIDSVIARNQWRFDSLQSEAIWSMSEEQLDEMLSIVAPEEQAVRDQKLDRHYEIMEAAAFVESPIEFPVETVESSEILTFLSEVLAGSELIDDIILKTNVLRHVLKGWASLAEEFGTHEQIRPVIEEFLEEELEGLGEYREMFTRLSWLFMSVMMISTVMISTLKSVGMGVALRNLNEDEDVNSSALQSMYLTILYDQMDLSGTPERIYKTFHDHRDHFLVPDVLRYLALKRYMSNSASAEEVKKLEDLLIETMNLPTVGKGQTSSKHDNENRTRSQLRKARLGASKRGDRHHDLIEDLLS